MAHVRPGKRVRIHAKLSYFTPNGKHFKDVAYRYKCVEGKELMSFRAHIRGLVDDGSTMLPGLAISKWDGMIHVSTRFGKFIAVCSDPKAQAELIRLMEDHDY